MPCRLLTRVAPWQPVADAGWQEHDNTSEALIKDTVVYDDDTPLLRQLKLTMVEMYNLRLERRCA